MDDKIRKIFIIGIIAICIICLILTVLFKFMEKEKDVSKKEEVLVIDTVELSKDFYEIFNNKINFQNNVVPSNIKKDITKDLVYTYYTKNESEEINVNIPKININGSNVDKINDEIDEIFYKKMENIIKDNNSTKSIYSVKYNAYINDNILSLIIISDLQEGTNSKREIVKTYNYNISSNQLMDLNQIINFRKLNNSYVQEKINNTIRDYAKKIPVFQELENNRYIRDINDDIYKVENTKEFFLGEGKALYILYPYGNSNNTVELDLVII